MKTILKQISGKNRPGLITIYGEEPYFREELLKELLKKLEDCDIQNFDGATVSESEVLGGLQEYSFTGASKVVVLRRPEKMKGKLAAFTDYLQDPSDENLLILYSEEKTAKKEPLKTAISAGLSFNSQPLKPFGNEYEQWLIKQVNSDGFSMSEDTARIIVGNVGQNLYLLKREIEKVYLCIDGTLITRSDLPGVINRTVKNQIFEFTEAVGRRDQKKTLRLLDNLYSHGAEPAMLALTALMNHFEKLLKMISLKDEGFDAKAIAEQCEVHPFRYKKVFEPQARKFALVELLKYMKRLCELDVDFRTGITDKRVALESFLVKVCTDYT